jgi:hypothetical protein
MTDIAIEQALYLREGTDPPRRLARSPGFREEWHPDVEWLITGLGERPPGVACPAAVFAQPLGKQHVAVIQFTDQDAAPGAPTGSLLFHVVVIPRPAYTRFLGDPFAVAQRLPAPWQARDTLPVLALSAESLPPRTVEDVRKVLQRTRGAALPEDVDPTSEEAQQHAIDNAESPALLGGVQVLVDGGRVVFERRQPDNDLMAGLWTLLPMSTRCHLWPASFSFSNDLGFDALIIPRASGKAFEGYTTEDQAADYPEGRYERSLQIAAQAGDQRELDALFGRRSVNETIRLAVTLLVVFSLLVLLFRVLEPGAEPGRESAGDVSQRAAMVASVVGVREPLNTVALLRAVRHAWYPEARP